MLQSCLLYTFRISLAGFWSRLVKTLVFTDHFPEYEPPLLKSLQKHLRADTRSPKRKRSANWSALNDFCRPINRRSHRLSLRRITSHPAASSICVKLPSPVLDRSLPLSLPLTTLRTQIALLRHIPCRSTQNGR
jgi:hypothetical protein